ncbi:MAG: adenosylcobalamin-dependent ribonucleoside-diphosphate reductase [Caldilineaceae bacterium]|nr:adenosylcobalamin-dependent ribonucleoside-diphosphate reductase [Caldilineaceae bacterium]
MSRMAAPSKALDDETPTTFTTMEVVKGEKVHITPPDYVSDVAINLSENSQKVLQRRYQRRDIDGTLLESAAGMFYRVAHHIAQAETAHGGDVEAMTKTFYNLLTELRFFPNSPTFTGAATPLGQLAACFVLPIADDMGRDSDGIFSTLRVAALIQQTGGGNGFSFSRLRPKGDVVHTSSGRATGPVGFLRVYDQAFGEIAQGGCLLPETLVFTSTGTMRLDELVDVNKDGWQNHQLSVPTDDGQRPSPRGFNNGVAPVLRVETEQGLTISGTPNHKVKVMTSEGPVWRQLDSLQPGDSILVMLGQHQGKLCALNRPQKTHGNQNPIEFPSILDEPLAFVLGYLAGDGFVAEAESDHRIGFSVAHNSYLIEEIPRLLQIVFPGCTVHTQQKSGDASVTFVIDSALVKRFLQMNGFVKGKSREVSVPRLVRRSPVSIVGAYLRGLFEADGTLSHYFPQLNTTSERLAREVATLLIGLGCPVSVRSNQYTERWGNRPQWIVRIQSHEGLAAWRQRIGCDQRSRFVVCHTFQPNLERETSYLLPNPDWWTGSVLDAITLPQIDRKQRGQNVNFRATDSALRRKLLRYSRGERQLTLSGYRELAAAHPEFAQHARPIDNLWFVTVSKVEEAGEALTLDLEVDENHTYLANGMVTHNTRRGANMAVLRVDHPDIEAFVTCKAEEGTVTNFNISVAITDEFMHAVKNDTDFDLRSPRDGKVWKTVRARELFDKIIHYAHRNGEPGALFIDAANRSNPVPHLYTLEATNPCGEQFLGPYENCCLGSINLGVHIAEDADGEMIVDWAALEQTVRESTHFLDNVVSANAYVPAVPEVAEAAFRARRIGLGIMGLGDLMYKLGIRYGSEEGQEFAGQVMEFVRYHCMTKSIELSEDRGPFLAFRGSIYDPEKAGGMAWQPPTPIAPYSRDWGRPSVDWPGIVEGIRQYGIRNAAQTTVAPTGTIATVSGCEGYGCEPVFALGYIRHFKDGDKDVELAYTSPLFEQALERTDLPAAQKQRIKQHVATYGSCQEVEGLPEELRHAFVVSSDISADEHVRMQAAIQAFVDNSISKTVNFSEGATEADVARSYLLAWELGCKGLTVYVTGSRQEVVLETKATKEKKSEGDAAAESSPNGYVNGTNGYHPSETSAVFTKRPRPKLLQGSTYRKDTPLGTAYITVNSDEEGEPFEVFLNIGKAGSDVSAVSEAMGRLISLTLRMPAALPPSERLRWVMDEMAGIGGGRALGFGANRVRSLPDGVAQVIAEHLSGLPAHPQPVSNEQMSLPLADRPIGDLCPDCGEAAFLNVEGCKKCHICGYSEC